MLTADQFRTVYSSELTIAVSLPDQITSHYLVNACLKSSDQKEVYLLTSLNTHEQVILRRLPTILSEINRTEYNFLTCLDHPHIPKGIDLFKDEDYSYLLRSYIQGISLQQWVAAHGLASEREAVAILVQLCDLLTYLHTHRPPIIHRDIKPQNVIIAADGTVYLIDFDIARRFDPTESKDTIFMGTSAIAPPEQYGYGQTDARSDLYSLGILLIFLCTGRYERTALAEMPPLLHRIAETCTQFSPKDRYPSAVKLKKALLSPLHIILKRFAVSFAVLCIITGAFCTGRLYERGQTTEVLPASALQPEHQTTVDADSTVSFADRVIEELVRDKLGKPAKETITLDELQTIKDLTVVGIASEKRTLPIDFKKDQAYQNGIPIKRGEIQSLSDLSLMKNLDHLLLAYQHIEDISPLKELQLMSLALVGNYITDLTPLAGMKTLQSLNINNNPIADISPLKSLESLEELHFQNCIITDISVLKDLPSLTFVDAASTSCSDYSVLTSLPSLSSADLSQTNAHTVAVVTGNRSLLKLIADECGIQSFKDFQSMPELHTLELSGNDLTDLEGIEKLPKLKILSIRKAKIEDLSPLISLKSLKELDLRGAAANLDLSPLLQITTLQKLICRPEMQTSINSIKDIASFEIEFSE